MLSSQNITKRYERITFMALQMIGKSTLPVSTRGKVGTMSVAVRENGQIGFSTSAGETFDNFTACMIGFDPDTRQMIFTPVDTKKLPKGVKAEDTFVIGQSKSGMRYISGAQLFKHESVGYDYKTSGTHSFPAENGNGKLTFTLPTEMAAKPKQERKPRAKKDITATANAAAPASGEPVLQEA
jgi:hypothetical protein